jgi:hypothetical protein
LSGTAATLGCWHETRKWHFAISWCAVNQSLIWLGVPMVMYALQGYFVYWEHGRYGMALCMISYAQANIGLVLDAYGI